MRILLPAATAALLALTLVSSSCSSRSAAGPRQKLLDLAPSDTVWLAGAKVGELVRSPLYQRMPDAIQGIGQITELTGVDPARDVDEILIASDGKTSRTYAHGRFQMDVVEGKILAAGGARADRAGKRCYNMKEGVLCLLDDGVIGATAAASADSLVAKPASKPAAAAVVARVPANASLWAVAAGGFSPLQVPQSSNLSNMVKLLESVKAMVAWADLRTSNLRLGAEGDCATEEDAKRLSGALRGLVGMARLATPDNEPEMLKLYDAVNVTMRSATIRIDAAVTDEQLLELTKKAGQRNR